MNLTFYLEKVKNLMSSPKRLFFLVFPLLGMGLFRLLLAFSVVFTHLDRQITFFGFIDGTMAVQSFFIVSGFYMALILNEKYKKYSDFIINRFLRIFPLYFSVLIISIIASFALSLFHRVLPINFNFGEWYAVNPFSAFLLLFTNIFIFGQDILFFLGSRASGTLHFLSGFNSSLYSNMADYLIVPQAWTLSLELMFYLIAPFVVRLKNKYLLSLIILAGCFRIALYFSLDKSFHDLWVYRFFPAEIVFFLVGIFSYKIYVFLKTIKISRKFFISFSLIFFLYFVFYTNIPINSAPKKGLFFLMVVFGIPILFLLSSRSRADRYIGDLSYPVYLSHFLIVEVFTITYNVPKEFLVISTVTSCILMSVLLYHYVISPVDLYRRKNLQTKTTDINPITVV